MSHGMEGRGHALSCVGAQEKTKGILVSNLSLVKLEAQSMQKVKAEGDYFKGLIFQCVPQDTDRSTGKK